MTSVNKPGPRSEDAGADTPAEEEKSDQPTPVMAAPPGEPQSSPATIGNDPSTLEQPEGVLPIDVAAGGAGVNKKIESLGGGGGGYGGGGGGGYGGGGGGGYGGGGGGGGFGGGGGGGGFGGGGGGGSFGGGGGGGGLGGGGGSFEDGSHPPMDETSPSEILQPSTLGRTIGGGGGGGGLGGGGGGGGLGGGGGGGGLGGGGGGGGLGGGGGGGGLGGGGGGGGLGGGGDLGGGGGSGGVDTGRTPPQTLHRNQPVPRLIEVARARDIKMRQTKAEMKSGMDSLPFYGRMTGVFDGARADARKKVNSKISRTAWRMWFCRDFPEKLAYYAMTFIASVLATPLYIAVILIKWVDLMGEWIIFVLGVANAVTAIVGTAIGDSAIQTVSAFLGMGIMIVLAIKKAFVEGVNVDAYNLRLAGLEKASAHQPSDPELGPLNAEGAPLQPEEVKQQEKLIKPQRYDEISGPWVLGAKALSWFFTFDDELDRVDYIAHLTVLVSSSWERVSAVSGYQIVLNETLVRIVMSSAILEYMVQYLPGGLYGDVQILLTRMIQDWQAFSAQHLDQRLLNLIVWERQERAVDRAGNMDYRVPRKDLLILIQSREFWMMAESFNYSPDSERICAILDDSETTAEQKIRLLRELLPPPPPPSFDTSSESASSEPVSASPMTSVPSTASSPAPSAPHLTSAPAPSGSARSE